MDITPYEAIERMRQLSDAGVPFSFTFNSLNTTKQTTEGLISVPRAVLRMGLRDDQSKLAHQLIAYRDLNKGDVPKFFHLPLLMSFNEHIIKP